MQAASGGAPRFDVGTLDYVIVVVYFVGVVAHGLWASRGQEDADDYFLAGRALPWYLIGFSLFASNMSGSSFVGLMGASYDYGLVVFNYEWTATLVLIFFAFFMLPHFLRARLFTIPGFLEKRFDRRSHLAFSLFTVLAIVFIDTAGGLYAGGIVITTVFDVSLRWAVGALALIAGLYTILGGLGAVVVTDTVQAILLLVGAAAILYFGLDEIGGWSEMMSRLAREEGRRTHLIQPADHGFLPWTGLFGVVLLGFYYWTLNQFVVQRALGAADLEQGRKGALFAGLLKLPNLFLMIVPGVFAVLLYPGIRQADRVFPVLAFDLLPIGFRGLILTAVIAAIMSSLDSALNAGSTLVTMDFVETLKPGLDGRTLMRIGRIATGVLVVVAALYSPMIRRFENLFDYFQQVLSYVTPPLVAVFLGGIFLKRVNGTGAFATILMALIVGVPVFITKEVMGLWEVWGLPSFHYTVMGSLMFLLGFALLWAVSLLTGEPDPERVRELTFGMEDVRADLTGVEGPWYRDARWQALGLVGVMTGLIVWFA